jgi:ribulose-bisphosphate carboxylase large chain
MAGSPEEDIIAAKNILQLFAKGHFFSQDWGRFEKKDTTLLDFIHEDHCYHLVHGKEWDKVEKCCPIISGGLNPTLLKSFIDIMGGVDFITTMGAGIHAHPEGTKAGAKALIQACEAYQKKIDIHKYAKTHKELAIAIEFFEKTKEKREESA